MIQISKYKNTYYLNNDELVKITNFFKEMFKTDNMKNIEICMEETSPVICVIDGYKEAKIINNV